MDALEEVTVPAISPERFRALLGEAMGRQRLAVADVTEFYLVNLLSEFVTAEKLFTPDDEGRSYRGGICGRGGCL